VTGVSMEMPKYKCHKVVHALKIAKLEPDPNVKPTIEQLEKILNDPDAAVLMTPSDEGYAPFKLDYEYMNRHKPQVGGYYVVYDDGYISYSPAKAFEDGYTRI
jgi:hypothetical protein